MEGKFSFLIIHALTNNPDDKQIMSILYQTLYLILYLILYVLYLILFNAYVLIDIEKLIIKYMTIFEKFL